MKNVLFIGSYRQSDGWGRAAIDYITSINKTSHNLKISPIYMSRSILSNPSSEILEIERRHFDHYDVIIQNCLPQFFVNHGHYKNIGLCYLETKNLQHTGWIPHMNQMDEMWVSNSLDSLTLRDSNLNSNVGIKNIPIPIDIDKFHKTYDPINIPELHDTFVFYFIGEANIRKNMDALLLAFHREFSTTEPVSLVIKTNKCDNSSKKVMEQVQLRINWIKQHSRIYSRPSFYKGEIVISDYMEDNTLMALHQECDCFVMPSYGEAYCRPAIDALGFGNQVIASRNTGLGQVLMDHTGMTGVSLVGSETTPVLTSDIHDYNAYTSRETWESINIIELQEAMRKAYNIGKGKTPPGSQVESLSYDKVATMIDRILNE